VLFDAGMASRFETVYFDDFNSDELESIWKLLCKEKGYSVGDDVSAVVRRRLSKQSGYKGFGNARAARKLFESAALHAMNRYRVQRSAGKQVELRVIMDDVIGQRPDRSTNAKVFAALVASQEVVSNFCLFYCSWMRRSRSLTISWGCPRSRKPFTPS
jgi:hypothetical protein